MAISAAISAGPKVSIGLPVRNGENYIQDAIISILEQTFQDFELIISDNASTDRTAEICQAWAGRDKRIRYSRTATNLGGAPNFNRTVELARGEYFKWAAHDDKLAPTFLEKCITALEKKPEAVLAYSHTQIINEQGEWVKDYAHEGRFQTQVHQPSVRFRSLVRHPHQCYQLFGVMRTQILRKTPLHGSYGHADGVLLARLALLGPFAEVAEPLFFARAHQEQTLYRFIWTQKRPNYRALTLWCDPNNASRLITPKWTILREYWRAIDETSMPPKEQQECFQEILRWAKTYWKGLLRDLGWATLYPCQKIIQYVWGTLKVKHHSKTLGNLAHPPSHSS